MTKTFKSALHASNQTLNVSMQSPGRFSIFVGSGLNITSVLLDAPDAPALALAILEAAGVEPVPFDECPETEAGHAAWVLRHHVQESEAKAKEAADRAALEADAWTLYTSAFPDANTYPSLERLPGSLRDAWVRVALKAREMKGAGDE